jgi:hypothetical protein
MIITDEMQSEITRQLNADIDKLGATALRIRDERDDMAAALNQIRLGCQIMLDGGALAGPLLAFVKNIKRVADAGLRERSVS